MMAASHTARLSAWVAEVQPADVPAEQLAQVKRVLLDALGCALYGAQLPWTRLLHSSLARFGGGDSHVIGISRDLPPDRAALVNGSSIQGYELDDYHQDAGIHSSACVVPAAIAAAEMASDVSGEDFLMGLLAGFEVGSRVGRCMNPAAVVGMGWHSGAIFSPLAATAAAGKILGLGPAQMENAFGISATQAGGLGAVQFGSMVKRMHHGRGAQSGLYGAVLAGDGYTGIARVFDQEYGGYCTTFVNGGQHNLNHLTSDLGVRFALDRIGLKPYACNAGIHSTLDALRAISRRVDFGADDVEDITVRMSKANLKHVGWTYSDATETAAQMNLPFCVAALVFQGDVFIEQFAPENVRSPALARFAQRVHPVHDPEIDKLGPSLRHRVEITVRLRSGATETQVEDYGRGSPMRPLTDVDVLDKFTKLVGLSSAIDDVAGLGTAILQAESVPAVAELLDRLVPCHQLAT